MNNESFIIGKKLLKIGNHLVNRRSNDLKKYNLTGNQSETLLYFDDNSGATIAELKKHLQVTHQAAQKNVERLKAKELLAISISKADGREKQIVLTPKGQEICDFFKKSGNTLEDNLLKELTYEESQQLSALLDKLSEGLDEFKRKRNTQDKPSEERNYI